MNKEQKRKLRNISLLALVGLIGGTFAFQAFNQQAINDRLRDNEVEVGGRVHDYYNRDTENKDVFVENYGQEPIIARIRLSEFMEIQHRGSTVFEPVVPGTSREDVANWTTWLPSATNLEDRQGDSNYFDTYSDLTFGWARNGEFAPWYLPTFNRDETDLRTASAGHARDWLAGAGVTDGTTDGATHPGDGTDAYWSEGEDYDNSAGNWFGSQVIQEAAQNLQQEKPPMTIDVWEELPDAEKIGDFWVIDNRTGWAYWASQLQAGEATSYLLDAAEMTSEAKSINGSYYYAINVESDLVSLDQRMQFLNPSFGGGHDERIPLLIEGIMNGAMDDGTGNPGIFENSSPNTFDFDLMNAGRIFTMANEQYRYLEDLGGGNHLIIRNNTISGSFTIQDTILENWYTSLDQEVKNIVRPVYFPSPVPRVGDADIPNWLGEGTRWVPNIENFQEVVEDISKVDQENGATQAFALSLGDVVRLSQNGTFSNHAERIANNSSPWWLRTPGSTGFAWAVMHHPPAGRLTGGMSVSNNLTSGGVRPALIVNNQQN